MKFSILILAGVAGAQLCEHQWHGPFAKRQDGDQPPPVVSPPPLEIRPLIVSGPSENRIDMIFFGDGYTEAEKDKFFEDAMFLATAVTDGKTFGDVRPIMNWWAGFSPSNESGIGTNGTVKDTVYGLYRPGTELRGVYYDKPDVAQAACASTTSCDFAILLGNDNLYGGLGGDFTVTTASRVNGPVILRHELGHSIIGVGEEYDGGYYYGGANSAATVDAVPWRPWYSSPEREPEVQVSNVPAQGYPWTMLNTSRPWQVEFDSAGVYAGHALQFSLSGLTSTADLRLTLDGRQVDWAYNADVGVDRYIYRLPFHDAPLAAGPHTLAFQLLNATLEGQAQLCNYQVTEYGAGFNFTLGHYSLYPTFDVDNQTTYRPTDDLCLMRNVYTSNFCSACIEGLWLALLTPLRMVDSVEQAPADHGRTEVRLELLELAQFRTVPATVAEEYTITWFSGNGTRELPEWANQTTAVLAPGTTEFAVEVRLTSSQIRSDPTGVTVQRRNYTVQAWTET